MALEIVGPHPFELNEDGQQKTRIGTIFPSAGVLYTSAPGVHALQRIGFVDRLNAELTPAEKAFYEGKVGSGRWFARTVLPKLASERAIAEATDIAIMDLDEAAF